MTLRSTSIWLPTVLSLTVVAIIVALEVVFCGTAVGPKSAKKGAYYAGPGNRFWSVLADSGLTPTCLDPSDYASLPQHGIGLTDLVKTKAALDADLAGEWDVDGFRGKMVRYAPTFVAFNGKRAAQEYYGKKVSHGGQTESIGRSTVFVLPSTSGAARKFWDVAGNHDGAVTTRSRMTYLTVTATAVVLYLIISNWWCWYKPIGAYNGRPFRRKHG